jgi:hypothetical protein
MYTRSFDARSDDARASVVPALVSPRNCRPRICRPRICHGFEYSESAQKLQLKTKLSNRKCIEHYHSNVVSLADSYRKCIELAWLLPNLAVLLYTKCTELYQTLTITTVFSNTNVEKSYNVDADKTV